MKKVIFLVFVILAIFIVSCSGKDKTEAKKEAGRSPGSVVLARVNGEELTLDEIRYQFPSEARDQLTGSQLGDAVETWINTMLLAQEGRKTGLDKDPAVRAVVDFRTADAIARKLLDVEVKDKNQVTQSEIDSVYAADKDKYRLDKERLRASHILVSSAEEAEAVYIRLKKGDDFAKLANDYSIDRQTATSGGDIGYFTEDQIDPEFAAAAAELQVGELSKPVKSAYGYHLIKLTDRQGAGSAPDSLEVKARISQLLTSNRQSEAFDALLDSLKKEAKIEKLPVPELNFPPGPDSL